jgi:hypothetical protein
LLLPRDTRRGLKPGQEYIFPSSRNRRTQMQLDAPLVFRWLGASSGH